MSVVSFNPAAFYAQFPELSSVGVPQLQAYFAMASAGLIDNTDTSVVPDLPPQGGLRTQVLYLATAHLTKLLATINGQAPSGLVGRIASAAEGGVNVSTELKIDAQSAQFWIQTTYGLMVWQMLTPYRTAFYTPGHVRNMSPAGFPGSPYGYWTP